MFKKDVIDDMIIAPPEQSTKDETVDNLDLNTDLENDNKSDQVNDDEEGIETNTAVSIDNVPLLELSEDLQFCSIDFKEDNNGKLDNTSNETCGGFFKSKSTLFSIPNSDKEKPKFSTNNQARKTSSYEEESSKVGICYLKNHKIYYKYMV